MAKSRILRELGIASTPNQQGGFEDIDQFYEIRKPEWEIVQALAVLLATLEFNVNNCQLMQMTFCPEIEHGDYTSREDRGNVFVLMGACPTTIASMTGCQKRRFLIDAFRLVIANEYGHINKQRLELLDEIVPQHWNEKLLRFTVLQKTTKAYDIEIALNYCWKQSGARSFILTYTDKKLGVVTSTDVELHSFLHLEHLLGTVVRKNGHIVVKPKLSGYDLFRSTGEYEMPLSINIEDMEKR